VWGEALSGRRTSLGGDGGGCGYYTEAKEEQVDQSASWRLSKVLRVVFRRTCGAGGLSACRTWDPVHCASATAPCAPFAVHVTGDPSLASALPVGGLLSAVVAVVALVATALAGAVRVSQREQQQSQPHHRAGRHSQDPEIFRS